jgi:hypothetical protein
MPKLIHFAPDIADEAMRRGHPTGVQWPDSPWGGPLHDRGNYPVPGKFSGQILQCDAHRTMIIANIESII